MSDKITSIKKNKKSSMDWTVVESLRDLIGELESGEVTYNRCVILLLDDKEQGSYNTGFRMSQITGSQAVALLNIMKSDIINSINGLPSSFS